MNPMPGSAAPKNADGFNDGHGDKRDTKATPGKILNRVPRACSACRRQKMRCEGADNPPCRRCRNTGLECLFEKPSREATLTGEAGLERIRSLEAHVVEIRHGQSVILNQLADIQGFLRLPPMHQRPPPEFMPPGFQHSPVMQSPGAPTPTSVHSDGQPPNIVGGPPTYARGPGASTPSGGSRPRYPPVGGPLPGGPPPPGSEYANPPPPPPQQQIGPPSIFAPPPGPYPGFPPQSNVLPPFSALQAMGQQPGAVPQQQQQQQPPGNVSSVRFQPSTTGKRPASSGASSDGEDDNGELPASGLVAPWEVLRGLADVAIERAAKWDSRPRTPTDGDRPAKRRKVRHKTSRIMTFPDVVSKNIITEVEARDLFRMIQFNCFQLLPWVFHIFVCAFTLPSKFFFPTCFSRPVFDSKTDTFDVLHERSPFAVNAICMVAARVRDGGGKPSETYLRCLEEVQAISCATLFVPVSKVEAVQSMLLVSGWSDNGWLSGGHAVRMALELSLHKAWPMLLQRINNNQANPTDDRELVVASRTWFTLYLFEHQLSYGTGRPAILKDDDSIRNCRLLLQHPLAIEDDMRLVSTVEMMALRERLHNALSLTEGPVREQDFEELGRADQAFQAWFATWDAAFSQKYEDAAFYRQSLKVQQLHSELFHNAVALRGIDGPEDVEKMPPPQREVAIRSIHIARSSIDITINSPAYKEGLKYAVHYTHATATFTASLLLRLARLFPNDCDLQEIKHLVERLAALMAEVPGKRYALTLQLMLKRFQTRRMSTSSGSSSRSPTSGRMRSRRLRILGLPGRQRAASAYQYSLQPGEADHIWRGLAIHAAAEHEQTPVWISDQSLGGQMFTQHGMNAFLLPTDYLPPVPQIW
ncbi:hypothetical protein BDZ89DRAFT_1091823 [Hymenopellis radicata]|nr:hypothetical protein BDZ89DRAFT_1091823 [Hymenopellis radicata]